MNYRSLFQLIYLMFLIGGTVYLIYWKDASPWIWIITFLLMPSSDSKD
ncbi:hypothetical protein CLV58_11911 [Spirosoma oryzae]|uniref:Uncharacterized protein n=1 Tax=Spirosoma oryzae TaxID=1469603 RepID=A0A2T0SKC1_9BACT|nr:hypothetical protein [Spirosoma oryzae]PRY33862.1 hypothetical protein CLV58_11911 [Spirosoma oryzae]